MLAADDSLIFWSKLFAKFCLLIKNLKRTLEVTQMKQRSTVEE